jgi:S1-C subfamily serine protease
MMGMKGEIRKRLLIASLGITLLEPISIGAVGAILVGTAAGKARAQQTLSTEAIAQIAQAITVRIEGATQGSGVLVKREENRYTVLTAWHVVSGQRPGEELSVYTIDGQSHKVLPKSIIKIGSVDMAELTFISSNAYQLAQAGDPRLIRAGGEIYVIGYPVATSAIPIRLPRFLKGNIIANSARALPGGYEILYSNTTLPGMSGGAVINAKGYLVGIHGQAELDQILTDKTGIAVKTGTNQAIPISYYIGFNGYPTQETGAIGIHSSRKSIQDIDQPDRDLLNPAQIPAPKANMSQITRQNSDGKPPAPGNESMQYKLDPACELRLSLGYRC